MGQRKLRLRERKKGEEVRGWKRGSGTSKIRLNRKRENERTF